MKTCTKCGRSLPATRDYFYTGYGKLLSRCKDCRNAAHREWVAKNAEKNAEYQRQWWLENHEHRREYNRQWHKDHPDIVGAGVRRWADEHRDTVADYHRNRRALLRGASGSHTTADIVAQITEQQSSSIVATTVTRISMRTTTLTTSSRLRGAAGTVQTTSSSRVRSATKPSRRTCLGSSCPRGLRLRTTSTSSRPQKADVSDGEGFPRTSGRLQGPFLSQRLLTLSTASLIIRAYMSSAPHSRPSFQNSSQAE